MVMGYNSNNVNQATYNAQNLITTLMLGKDVGWLSLLR